MKGKVRGREEIVGEMVKKNGESEGRMVQVEEKDGKWKKR